MRSYYRPGPAAPLPVPQAAAAAPVRKRRKGTVLFAVTLGLILVLAAVLGGLTLGGLISPYAADWGEQLPQPSYSAQDRPNAGVAPAIPLAEHGDGTTLTLVSAEGKQELSFQDIYEKNIASIVGIYSSSQAGGSFGTGVILTADGYLVTNAHVVEGGEEVTAVLYDGTLLECSLVGFDPYSDLAVLRVTPDAPLTPAEFGDSDQLRVGDVALALGHPLGAELWGTMTDGIISAINRDVEMDDGTVMTLIQTTAALNTGNSGGALLNSCGQVVGITNMKIMADDSTIEGLGFAIPSTLVKQAADAMIAAGSFEGTPSIGITGATAPDGSGVRVYTVDRRSDAWAQGVRPGDIITAVNGTPVSTVDEINAVKLGWMVGDTVTLTLSRDGERLTVEVRLVGAYSLN